MGGESLGDSHHRTSRWALRALLALILTLTAVAAGLSGDEQDLAPDTTGWFVAWTAGAMAFVSWVALLRALTRRSGRIRPAEAAPAPRRALPLRDPAWTMRWMARPGTPAAAWAAADYAEHLARLSRAMPGHAAAWARMPLAGGLIRDVRVEGSSIVLDAIIGTTAVGFHRVTVVYHHACLVGIAVEDIASWNLPETRTLLVHTEFDSVPNSPGPLWEQRFVVGPDRRFAIRFGGLAYERVPVQRRTGRRRQRAIRTVATGRRTAVAASSHAPGARRHWPGSAR